jgi:hypothetical protein
MSATLYTFLIALCLMIGGVVASDRYMRRVSARLGCVSPPGAARTATVPSGWRQWLLWLSQSALVAIGLWVFFASNNLAAHAVLLLICGEMFRRAYVYRVRPLKALGATPREVSISVLGIALFVLPLAWALHMFLKSHYGAV